MYVGDCNKCIYVFKCPCGKSLNSAACLTIAKKGKPKQTNADSIRSMNDAELAEFIANKGSYIACCQCDYFNHDEEKCESPYVFLCTKGYAEALILKWLQSEVE